MSPSGDSEVGTMYIITADEELNSQLENGSSQT